MADEIRNGDAKVRVVRLLGHRDDAGAWEIRDFLKRSVVAFQWIELSTEKDGRRELGLSDLKHVNLPVVELPDGTRLFGPTMREGVKATFHGDRLWTDLAAGGTMIARGNVCATGVEWRRLNLPNEDKLLGRGLYYGAGASEAPLCGGEDVYVVGGGNSAGQAVMHLAKYARTVTMLVRDKALAASMSQYLSERIIGTPNVQVRYDVEITGLEGRQALERIQVGSRTTKEANWLATPRLFVALGGRPNTDWATDTATTPAPGRYIV